MSVSPGNPILQTDLAALATPANGLTSVNFDLTKFACVSPLYNDGSGNPYGHREFSGVTIDPANPGTGYKHGDLLSLGTGAVYIPASYEVVQVSSTGAVLGIRPISNGAGQYTDPSGSITTTGGSGTGVNLLYAAFAQVGPTANFSFPDYAINNGSVTGFYIVAGGTGFTVGDTLGIAGLTSLVLTVVAVSGGAITAVTITTPTSATTVPQNIGAMPATAITGSGTGAVFGGYFALQKNPDWLTELNRLRNDLYNLPGLNGLPAFMSALSGAELCVSGPWPVSGPTANFLNTWFYFADTGVGATITVASSLGTVQTSYGKYTNATMTMAQSVSNGIRSDPAGCYSENCGTAYGYVYFCVYPVNVTKRFAFVIGGQDPLAISGTFNIYLQIVRGGTTAASGVFTPDTVDPATLVSVNQSPSGGYHAFPGTVSIATTTNNASTPYFGGMGVSGGRITIAIAVSGTYAPGRYELEVDVANPGNDSVDSSTSIITSYTRAILNSELGPGNVGVMFGAPAVTASKTYSTAVATAGIHNSKQIYKIQLPGDAVGNGPGLYCVESSANAVWNVPAYVAGSPYGFFTPDRTVTYPNAVAFGDEKIIPVGWNISTSTTGFWSALCQWVSSLNAAVASLMPWNLNRTKYGSTASASVNPALLGDLAPNSPANTARISNSYDNTQPVEAQLEPPLWKASTYFTLGFQIMDSNGNFQICTQAGTSGSGAPGWSSTLGNLTNDPNSSGAIWKCAAKPSPAIAQSAHRQLCIPRYPVYWYSETNPFLKPPTGASGLTIWGANNQWQRNNYAGTYDPGWQQDNLAFGWWIYSVRIDRMMTNPGSQVAVTIGCMRSGSFVAFGTHNTGATYQVLWPVFTSDAMVYQCSERVDLQAVAIASGGAGVATGPTAAGYPLCAAFVSDTTALLALIT
jgi:hypothetical protein